MYYEFFTYFFALIFRYKYSCTDISLNVKFGSKDYDARFEA